MKDFKDPALERQHDQHGPSEYVADEAGNAVAWDVYFAEFHRFYGNPFEVWVDWCRRRELPEVHDHRAAWVAISRQQVASERDEKLFAISLIYDDEGFPVISERMDFPAKRGNPEIISVLDELGIRPNKAAKWSRETIRTVLKRMWRLKWHQEIDCSATIPAHHRDAAKAKADQIIEAAFKEKSGFTRKPCSAADCPCSICKGRRKSEGPQQ